MEISISAVWRKRIFASAPDEVLKLSAEDGDIIPEYVRDVIVSNGLVFNIQKTDDCEERFDEGLVVFRFSSAEYPDIVSFSGNNPDI